MSSFRNKNNKSKRLPPKQTRVSLRTQLEMLTEQKRLVNDCLHFTANPLSGTYYSDTGIYVGGWTCSNLIAQGVTSNQRIGYQVKLKSIKYTFNIYAPISTPDTCRIMIILDKQSKTQLPLKTDIFNNPANGLSTISPASRKSYSFLHDSFIDVGGYQQLRTIKFTIKLNLNSTYFSAGNTLSDLQTGTIYVFAISVNGTGSTEILNFQSVTTYIDI
jgi:hypothetical protein